MKPPSPPSPPSPATKTSPRTTSWPSRRSAADRRAARRAPARPSVRLRSRRGRPVVPRGHVSAGLHRGRAREPERRERGPVLLPDGRRARCCAPRLLLRSGAAIATERCECTRQTSRYAVGCGAANTPESAQKAGSLIYAFENEVSAETSEGKVVQVPVTPLSCCKACVSPNARPAAETCASLDFCNARGDVRRGRPLRVRRRVRGGRVRDRVGRGRKRDANGDDGEPDEDRRRVRGRRAPRGSRRRGSSGGTGGAAARRTTWRRSFSARSGASASMTGSSRRATCPRPTRRTPSRKRQHRTRPATRARRTPPRTPRRSRGGEAAGGSFREESRRLG